MKRDIFKKRINFKPYEYPEIIDFKDAIRNSYWLHNEFNFTADIQDFKTNVNDSEREIITRAMLAISQIEVTVKRFWADIYNYFPKPEIDAVGVTFAESEVRHADSYANLLELLGLNEMFEHIHEYPALQARVDYVESFMTKKNLNHQGFVLSLTLFSLFIEHISLFSQFYIMMSFNKFKNLFKGISNAVEATSKEEEIHGRFGIALYNIIKEEQPKMFDQEFYKDLVELAEGAFSAEMQIIDWIYESGDLSFASKDVVKNYISSRYNNSMNSLGIDYKFPVDEKMLEETAWFDHEILTSKEIDFFNKRSIDYSKRGKAITADDLF